VVTALQIEVAVVAVLVVMEVIKMVATAVQVLFFSNTQYLYLP
jgi:hypothetical protein